MRIGQDDNAKLVRLVGQYMQGEKAMESIQRRYRNWVAREILGIETNNCVWSWRRHWRGHCLESGIDPKTFEITDSELFNAAWARYEQLYWAKKERKRAARIEREKGNFSL